jgi:hypothetical protein
VSWVYIFLPMKWIYNPGEKYWQESFLAHDIEMKKGWVGTEGKRVFHKEGIIMPVLLFWVVSYFLWRRTETKGVRSYGPDWRIFCLRYLFCISVGKRLALTCAIKFILLIWKGEGTEMTTVEWVNWNRQGSLWARVIFASTHFQNCSYFLCKNIWNQPLLTIFWPHMFIFSCITNGSVLTCERMYISFFQWEWAQRWKRVSRHRKKLKYFIRKG